MNRRKAREQAVCLVYERAFHPELATEQFYEEALADREIPEDTFLHELFFTACERQEETDALIGELASAWDVRRISKVSLAVLRVAICEMRYLPEQSYAVAINEAVELAKKFGDEKSGAFVNGILGAAARRFPEEATER